MRLEHSIACIYVDITMLRTVVEEMKVAKTCQKPGKYRVSVCKRPRNVGIEIPNGSPRLLPISLLFNVSHETYNFIPGLNHHG